MSSYARKFEYVDFKFDRDTPGEISIDVYGWAPESLGVSMTATATGCRLTIGGPFAVILRALMDEAAASDRQKQQTTNNEQLTTNNEQLTTKGETNAATS